jgi:hypothetical protein
LYFVDHRAQSSPINRNAFAGKLGATITFSNVSYSAHLVMGRQRNVQCETAIDAATDIRAARAPLSMPLEVVVKANKRKKSETPDLRHGVKGSVAVKDTNENFAGKRSSANASGPKTASPDFDEPAGQTTHE